jgi:integrase
LLYFALIYMRNTCEKMIRFKASIKPREENKQKLCNIKICVCVKTLNRYISTNFFIEKKYFKNKLGKVDDKHPNSMYINIELQKLIFHYQQKIADINEDIELDELMKFLKDESSKEPEFFEFVDGVLEQLKAQKKNSYANSIFYSLPPFKLFLKKEKLLFKNIDYKLLSDYETYLLKNGLKINAISVYLRNIRTVFNKAINQGLIGLELYPFRRFKIKNEKTFKRNLQIDQLKLIKNAILPEKQAYARDMFMLSFYLIGMNMVDIFNLVRINGDCIMYRRAKTSKLYTIKLLPGALDIIKRYPGKDKLMNCSEIYSTISDFRKCTNKFLKAIFKKLEMDVDITTYYARHSWATIAASIDIPKETISAALGHEIGSSTTSIYIDFDLKKVDAANQLVYDYISK